MAKEAKIAEKPVETTAREIVLKAENAIAEVSKIVIRSPEELTKASEVLSNLKKLQKFIKQEKDKALNPIKETVDTIKGWFAPAEEKALAAESNLKKAMASYQDEVDAENTRKANAIAARAQKEGPGSLKPETAVKKMEELGQVATNVKTTAGKTVFSKVKKVKITDPTKVPDQYWIVNEVALRAAALAESKATGKLGEVIPGCEVYEETSVSAS